MICWLIACPKSLSHLHINHQGIIALDAVIQLFKLKPKAILNPQHFYSSECDLSPSPHAKGDDDVSSVIIDIMPLLLWGLYY